jgi:hypothetical protein
MTTRAFSSVPLNTIGKILGQLYLYGCTAMTHPCSVRSKIRDGHPDFIVTADSWPALVYPYGKGNVDDIEKGLFQSAILVKVRSLLSNCAMSIDVIS